MQNRRICICMILSTDEVQLLQSGTAGGLLDDRSFSWKDSKTIVYRSQDDWYAIDIEAKQKTPLFTGQSNGENTIAAQLREIRLQKLFFPAK